MGGLNGMYTSKKYPGKWKKVLYHQLTMHSYPVVQVFPLGQPHCRPQIYSGVQAGLSLLIKTVPDSAVSEFFFRTERLKLEKR